MARIKGPLFSTAAAGRVASVLTFGRSASGALARAMLKPAGARPSPLATASQQTRRDLYAVAVADWHSLDEPTKNDWRALGKLRALTGFNCFMRAALTVPPSPLGTQWDSGATTWDSGATTWDV